MQELYWHFVTFLNMKITNDVCQRPILNLVAGLPWLFSYAFFIQSIAQNAK